MGDLTQKRGWLPFRGNELALILALGVVVLLTILLDSGRNYLHDPLSSLEVIARQTALLGIFALGAAVVIISGGIDLSSGSMIAFSGTIFAATLVVLAPEEMERGEDDIAGWTVGTAVVVTLLVSFLIGSLHAWLITVVGLPPFIATLASLVGLRSLGRAIVSKLTEVVYGRSVTQIAVYDTEFRALARNVPVLVAIFLVLALLVWILLSRTVTGRHLYAHGGNEQAARLSGIRTDRIKWVAYVIGTLTASIAGMLYVGDQAVADPQTLGVGYELNAIAAAVVGGCSLQGGIGTVPGIVLGALFLRTVMDGIAKVIKRGADVYEGLIVGIVVVFAVASSQFRQAIRQGQQIFPGALGIVNLVTLSLLAGLLSYLMSTAGVGITVGLVAFALFVGVRFLEGVRRRRPPRST